MYRYVPIMIFIAGMVGFALIGLLIQANIISSFVVEIIGMVFLAVFTIICSCLWLFGEGDRKQEGLYAVIGGIGFIVCLLVFTGEHFI